MPPDTTAILQAEKPQAGRHGATAPGGRRTRTRSNSSTKLIEDRPCAAQSKQRRTGAKAEASTGTRQARGTRSRSKTYLDSPSSPPHPPAFISKDGLVVLPGNIAGHASAQRHRADAGALRRGAGFLHPLDNTATLFGERAAPPGRGQCDCTLTGCAPVHQVLLRR